MSDEAIPVQGGAPPTPMGRVWLIVLGTMLVSGSLAWMWHLRAIAEAHAENLREAEKIRARIVELETYRDVLRAEGMAGAETYLFGGAPEHDRVEDDPTETPELM